MSDKTDYSKTVNLHESPFPMRGNLAKREPGWVKQWQEQNRYQKLREKAAGRTIDCGGQASLFQNHLTQTM